MANLSTGDSLRFWLAPKPRGYGETVATRAALRALPAIRNANDSWLRSHTLDFFRIALYSWAKNEIKTVVASDRDAEFDFAVSTAAKSGSRSASSGCYALINAAISIDAEGKSSSIDAAADAAEDAAEAIPGLWRSISADCEFLTKANKQIQHDEILNFRRLWIGKPTKRWGRDLPVFRSKISGIDPAYSVWIEWYDRRISGDRAAFDIPGDEDRTEDKAILRRIAEATDEDFWGKGHEFVNSELTRWLEEARARAASNLVPLTTPPALPAQNPNAITFRAVAGDKIDIDSAALGRQVKTDGGAQERYAEAISEARLWLDRCQSSNAGARLTRLLENYLAAAGERLETASHALLVQRGERLRQELARYEAADNMLPPIADDLLLDGMGWRSAHNMMVGLDPVLHAADVAMLGPDRKPGLIPPQEIIALARDADAKDLLEEGVAEIVIEAAQLAPDPPDQTDRRTVWSIETAQNLIIEAFAIALNYPKTAAGAALVGTALYAALGVGGIGAISIMGSIRAAEYLVVHQGWILQRLGNTPTWQALIAELADWLKRVTPFNPK